MKAPPVIHPLLFAVYPVIYLYAHSQGEIGSISVTFLSASFFILLAVFFLIIFRFIYGNLLKAGVVASVSLVLVFSFGHVASFLAGAGLSREEIPAYLYALWAAVFSFTALAVYRTRNNMAGLTKGMNLIAAFLVLMNLVKVVSYELETRRGLEEAMQMHKTAMAQKTAANAQTNENIRTSDIYYIILDRYGNNNTLKNIYGYDNAHFLEFLRSKGFYVADESFSNYLKTAHSLASSLNMKYVNFLSEVIGRDSNDWRPLYEMLQNYEVWRFLKSRGYDFIHFGSWWGPTMENRYADENINLQPFFYISEFDVTLFETTLLHSLISKLVFKERDRNRRLQWKRVNFKFKKLMEIPATERKAPVFVFAHMLIPHPPYVFDERGRYIPAKLVGLRSESENYIRQLMHLNDRLEKLVDTILSKSEVPPIIILQSDEGPYPYRYINRISSFNWKEEATVTELRHKVGIINAYYFPGRGKENLYPTITPVNTFKVLFNTYFNSDYELLPDRSFAHVDDMHIYDFVDVTDKIKMRDPN
ncbi:MAG: hypothetical protein V3S46_03030 [Nitrospinota bacterium]